jgi:hypothetical protein
MSILQSLKHSGQSRVFALLTLLFVLGLQSLEVSHSHQQHDSAVECLACKNSSVGAISVAPALMLDSVSSGLPLPEKTIVARSAAFSLYEPRGPPTIS